jgi:hypothetical protein
MLLGIDPEISDSFFTFMAMVYAGLLFWEIFEELRSKIAI